MNNLAKSLRDARQRAKMSQAHLAALMGVNQSSIHRWETDGPSGALSRLAVAEALKICLENHQSPPGEASPIPAHQPKER